VSLTQDVALSGAIAGGLALIVTPWLTHVLWHRKILDHPNERSLHAVPTPRGGGIAVAVAAVVALGVSDVPWAPKLELGSLATAFGAIGLSEDAAGVPPMARLGAQTIVAIGAVPLVLRDWNGGPTTAVILAICAVIGIVGFTNVFNFMDGINGIAAAQATVAGATWLALGVATGHELVAVSGVVIAAAALGFVPWNFPNAKVFLGDTGSYLMGAWLAITVAVALRAGLPPEAVCAPLSLFVVDAAWTLLGRARRAEPILQPHRNHVYQQLVQRGWSHAKTTGTLGALMAILSCLGAVSLSSSVPQRVAADVGISALLAAYVLSPGLVELRGRASATGNR